MPRPYIPSVYIPPTGERPLRLDLATVKAGDEIPTLMRRGDLQHWNRFAAVNSEFAGHHMDDEVGRHEGFEAAIGMGQFIYGLLQLLMRQWIGEENGRVVEVSMQSRRPWVRGRTLTEGGRVTEIRQQDGEVRIRLQLWADNDLGERLADGEGEVAVFR